MIIDWDDVVDFAPELSTVAAGAQFTILAWVNSSLKAGEAWGTEDDPMLKLARILLASHFGTVGLPGANGFSGGAVTRERVGEVEREYAASVISGTDPLLDSTTYGTQYRALARNNGARGAYVL